MSAVNIDTDNNSLDNRFRSLSPSEEKILIYTAFHAIKSSFGPEYNEEKMKPSRIVGEPFNGAFVTLMLQERLRGCIGSIAPISGYLEPIISELAISAAFRDPRFHPLAIEELSSLTIEISLLDAPQVVFEHKDLDPSRYGVIMTSGYKRAVLLPDIPGVDSVETQLKIVREKAGISLHEAVHLERFSITKIKDIREH